LEQQNRATAQRWQNGQYDDVSPVHIDRIAENCGLNRRESAEIEKLKSQLAAAAAGPGRSRGALLRDPCTVKNFFYCRAGAGPGPQRVAATQIPSQKKVARIDFYHDFWLKRRWSDAKFDCGPCATSRF
jgi:hypothetical protein